MNLKFFASVTGMVLLLNEASPQALVNNFANIHIKQGAQVFVKTNSVSNHDLIENAGEFTIERDFINYETANGGSSNGIYFVQRHWVNNGTFRADQSEVRLYGADQLITGTEVTVFYNLTLTGSGIKRQTINSETSHLLALNDRELATDSFDMLVSNAATNAITRTTGFVSSLDTGKLSRNTNSSLPYLFPTGSSFGALRYRPVGITPSSSGNNTFGVRLANLDATNENFDRNTKASDVCEINPLFYHRIYQTAGTDNADLEIHYDAAADGDWQDIAHWQTAPQWERTNSASSFSPPFDTYLTNSWGNFVFSPFALARLSPSVDAGADTIIALGESVQLNPTVSGIHQTIAWSPSIYLDNPSSGNPVSTPDSTITYTVTLDEGSPCKADDNITIVVIQESGEIAIPQAFSPNNDGTNDFFLILNPEILESVDIKIFNRWGQIVFETADKNFKWDGTFKGQPQDLGVFVWMADAKMIGNTTKARLSGNITLIR